jgi:hypothetical protein
MCCLAAPRPINQLPMGPIGLLMIFTRWRRFASAAIALVGRGCGDVHSVSGPAESALDVQEAGELDSRCTGGSNPFGLYNPLFHLGERELDGTRTQQGGKREHKLTLKIGLNVSAGGAPLCGPVNGFSGFPHV